jgi:hypothetical protein
MDWLMTLRVIGIAWLMYCTRRYIKERHIIDHGIFLINGTIDEDIDRAFGLRISKHTGYIEMITLPMSLMPVPNWYVGVWFATRSPDAQLDRWHAVLDLITLTFILIAWATVIPLYL